MHSPAILAKKYLKYYAAAASSKGHGIHSPFVFEFVKFVLNDKKYYECFSAIEAVRKQLLKNNGIIEVEDFGAGSSVIKNTERKISAIAASSLKPKKYGQLLFRIVQFYKLQNVLELGTSFGITTSYLASAGNHPAVISLEGSATIAAVARHNLSTLQLNNATIITGDFAATLVPVLQDNYKTDFVFLDGNHRKAPTLLYFEQLLSTAHNDTIFVFDDIYWSNEMEEAWQKIKEHPAVTLTISLFFIGLVFLKKEFKVKQHFSIRF